MPGCCLSRPDPARAGSRSKALELGRGRFSGLPGRFFVRYTGWLGGKQVNQVRRIVASGFWGKGLVLLGTDAKVGAPDPAGELNRAIEK